MFFLFLFAHLVADFVLQPFWLVKRKRYWYGLFIHGSIVLICMLLLPLADPAVLTLWPTMLGITAVHIAADWWKVKRADKLFSPPIVPFLLDQIIHITTLGVALSLVLPVEQVWVLDGSPLVRPALYACVYLVAACATPIAVMVWLDPVFNSAPLAGGARARSLIASTTVTSLALFGGALALPATLLGLLIATRRPASSHPLDMPTGLMIVLCVAATLGSALTLMW